MMTNTAAATAIIYCCCCYPTALALMLMEIVVSLLYNSIIVFSLSDMRFVDYVSQQRYHLHIVIPHSTLEMLLRSPLLLYQHSSLCVVAGHQLVHNAWSPICKKCTTDARQKDARHLNISEKRRKTVKIAEKKSACRK